MAETPRISEKAEALVKRLASFKNTGHPLTKGQRQRRNAALNDLRKHIHTLEEDGSAGWECLDMVRETLVPFLGEDSMRGTAPMFYPEAIRSAMFRAQRGDYLKNAPAPENPAVSPEVSDV